jgi:hypothetical protein
MQDTEVNRKLVWETYKKCYGDIGVITFEQFNASLRQVSQPWHIAAAILLQSSIDPEVRFPIAHFRKADSVPGHYTRMIKKAVLPDQTQEHNEKYQRQCVEMRAHAATDEQWEAWIEQNKHKPWLQGVIERKKREMAGV